MNTVLIAEDNATNRELLRELLEMRGYAVVEACNGQEALDMVEQTRPDILLLDLGMPVLDGFAVVRRIRENPRLAMLPVLAVTAYAMQGDREKVLNSGFDGYLAKPINARALEGELDRLASKPDGQKASRNQSHESQTGTKIRAANAGDDK
jgi:CheY-like chemotaxis protein